MEKPALGKVETKHIYCWFDQRYNAIKLGHAFDPVNRMWDYANFCNLRPIKSTLRTAVIADWTHVFEIERDCFYVMKRFLSLSTVGNLNELFYLYELSYDKVADEMMSYVSHRQESILNKEGYTNFAEVYERSI